MVAMITLIGSHRQLIDPRQFQSVSVTLKGGARRVTFSGLFVFLGFNGTFSTNRLYHAITVGKYASSGRRQLIIKQ